MAGPSERPTVVLVHGAWADGSSWNDVTGALLSKGLNVLAAPIPLTSLSDDIAALDRVLERTSGSLVLVAHAYGGAVIAGSTNERVRSLAYIAALAPDEGETVAEVFYREKPHPEAPELAPDAHGFIWMPREAFATAFAQNASADRAALFAATQRPIAIACIQEKALRPAWRVKPVDRDTIAPQRDVAGPCASLSARAARPARNPRETAASRRRKANFRERRVRT